MSSPLLGKLFVSSVIAFGLLGCDTQAPEESSDSVTPPAPAATPAGTAAPAPTPAAGTNEAALTPAKPATPSREIVLASGLSYRVLQPGAGTRPKAGSTVVYHWTGWLPNGREIWDTRRTGVPQQDVLSHTDLIPGLVEALLDMKVGERRELHIPASLAYGEQGYRFVVPPRSALRVDVELVGVGS